MKKNIKKKSKNSFNEEMDTSFYLLADSISKQLKVNNDGSSQKEQVEKLLNLENKFKKSIKGFLQTEEIYKKFILHIVMVKKNILTARPFFREKSAYFNKHISPAIKNGDFKELQKHSINYKMIIFIKENWLGEMPEESAKLIKEIEEARRVLIENNMPLAINRAKRFYRSVPKSHLTLMDMIALCAKGLASGIDKYSAPKYTDVFKSVCIGRMTAELMDAYSETSMNFSPTEKKIIYRLNSIRKEVGIENIEALSKKINESLLKDAEEKNTKAKLITPQYLFHIINATGILSTDYHSSVGDQNYEGDDNSLQMQMIHSVGAQEPLNPEETLEKNQYLKALKTAVSDLDILSIKVLKMKGLIE